MAMTISRTVMSSTPQTTLVADLLESYREGLTDLNFNSKPHINMLTMVAVENFRHGAQLVDVIERHIYQVQQDKKLPALYLIDSILKNKEVDEEKNIEKDFKPFFRPRLKEIFAHIFLQSDEKTRLAMYKLRHTWTIHFDQQFLTELDQIVNKIDPKWPVSNPQAFSTSSTDMTQTPTQILTGGGKPTEFPATSKVPEMVKKTESHSGLSYGTEASNGRTIIQSIKSEESGPKQVQVRSIKNGQYSPAPGARKRPSSEAKSLPRIPKKPALDKATTPIVKTRGRDNSIRGRMAPQGPHQSDRSRAMNQENRDFVGLHDKMPRKVLRDSRPLLQDPPSRGRGIRETGPIRPRGARLPIRDRHYQPYHNAREPFPRDSRRPQAHFAGFDPRYNYDGHLPYDEFTNPMPPPQFVPAIPTAMDDYQMRIQEAHEKLTRGEITSASHQQLLSNLKADFELRELQEAIKYPIQSDGVAPGRSYIPTHTVYIDGVLREVRWYNEETVVIIDGQIFAISFRDSPVHVYIDHIDIDLGMNEEKAVFFGTRCHKIKFGGPGHELIIDKVPYQLNFGDPEVIRTIDGQQHRLRLGLPAPSVEFDKMKPLYAEMLAPSDVGMVDSEMISRILSSRVFQELTSSVPAPLPIDSNLNRTGRPEDQKEEFSLTPAEAQPRSPAPLSLANEPAWKSYLREEIQKLLTKAGSEVLILEDEPNLLDANRATNDLLHYSTLRKLHLHVDLPKDTSNEPRSLEQRFLPEEKNARNQNIRWHNWWIRKDEVVTGDWLIDANEFTNEKSFEADMSATELEEIFNEYILRRNPGKKFSLNGDSENSNLLGTEVNNKVKNSDPDKIIQEDPIAEEFTKHICDLCQDEIASVENEDDEYVLKNAVRVEDIKAHSTKYYHSECYEDILQTSEPFIVKPVSSWRSMVDDAPSTSQPANTRLTFVPLSEPTSERSGNDEIKQSLFVSRNDLPPVKQVSMDDFVININDEDEEDDELIEGVDA